MSVRFVTIRDVFFPNSPNNNDERLGHLEGQMHEANTHIFAKMYPTIRPWSSATYDSCGQLKAWYKSTIASQMSSSVVHKAGK